MTYYAYWASNPMVNNQKGKKTEGNIKFKYRIACAKQEC